MHGAYSDPSGDVLFFTVDEKVYDKDGWVVGDLKTGFTKKGWNERLILPMGNDCRRFAIIYPASAATTEGYGSTSDRLRIYMATYNLDGTNGYSPYAKGDLEGQTVGLGSSLTDITNRECQNESINYPGIYGCYGLGDPVPQGNYRGNYQIAATELIDNCFYYVYIFDGQYLMRYKLTANDLEWDDYVALIPQSGNNTEDQRTEMELIKLSNGDFRIAIPTYNSDGPYISIYDIDNTNYELDLSSHQQIDLSDDNTNTSAEMIGLEFDRTGRYLYFTHENNNTPQWQTSILDVYDFNTSSIVTSTLPTLTNISDYQYSFIERYGNTLYLASDDDLATLAISDSPGSAVWTTNVQSIPSGYKNRGGESFIGFERSILPEQLDMNYPDLTSFSCDCCANFSVSENGYIATVSETWTPGTTSNPFGSTSGVVYFKDDLIIKAGTDIEIDNMEFHFGPDARVIVERGEEEYETGAFLKLTNGAIFTADFRCEGREISDCENMETCEAQIWPGVIVEGYGNENVQDWNTSTNHGRMLMEDNSMVEFAQTGVRLGNPDLADSEGGMLRVYDSKFKDNTTGVRFDSYQRISFTGEVKTRSFIRNTEFTWTDEFYDFLMPNRHVEVLESSGVDLIGNTYQNENHLAYDPSDRGVGVYAADSKVRVAWFCTSTSIPCDPRNQVRSRFLNLKRGVEAFGLSGRLIEVHNSYFDNNQAGVMLTDQINTEVLDCDFHIPNEDNNFGVYLGSSTGYAVENNYFTSTELSPQKWNYGISIQASGQDDNEIYKNTFEDITLGIISSKQNANCNQLREGLKWRCNTFNKDILYADIYVANGTVSDEQGSCLAGPYGPAGNYFSHTSQNQGQSPLHYDIKVSGQPFYDDDCQGAPVALQVDYRHHSPLTNPLDIRMKPYKYTNTSFGDAADYVQLDQCGIAVPQDVCPVQNTSIPTGVRPKSSGELTMSSDSLNMSDVEGLFTEHYSLKDEYISILDGGNTEELLDLIQNAENVDQITTLIEDAGDMVSNNVVQALLSSPSENLNDLGYGVIDNYGSEEVSDTLFFSGLPSAAIERMVDSLSAVENKMWRRVIHLSQTDTANAFPDEEILGLFNSYTPQAVGQRYVAALCSRNGISEPSWIKAGNSLNEPVLESVDIADSELGLPEDIADLYSEQFFNHHSNIAALNAIYVDSAASYNPLYPEIPEYTIPEVDDNKSNNNAFDQDDTNAKVRAIPNPFSSRVSLDISELELADGSRVVIEFYDLVGKKVFETTAREGQDLIQINGNHLPTGYVTYIVTVDGTRMHSGKLLRMKVN